MTRGDESDVDSARRQTLGTIIRELEENVVKRIKSSQAVSAANGCTMTTAVLTKPPKEAYLHYRSHEAHLKEKLDGVAEKLLDVCDEFVRLRRSSLLDAAGIKTRAAGKIEKGSGDNEPLEATSNQGRLLEAWTSYKPPKLKDVNIPVYNVMMMKFIEESNEKDYT